MASAKLDELPNILNELDGKVIIWSRYVNSLENIISLLKKITALIAQLLFTEKHQLKKDQKL